MSTTTTSKRALGIVRVSTRKQDKGYSPGLQASGIREYATSQGLELVGIEIVHESGKDSRNRPRFNAALAKAKLQQAPHLIFWVWDRVGRNFTDFENLERDVIDGKAVIHGASEGRRLDANSPSTEWMALEALGLTAKQYSRDLRRRAIEGGAARARDGWYPAKAPLGYRNVRVTGPEGQRLDRRSRIELQPWGERVIRRMYDLRLTGFSLKAIADQVANEERDLVETHLRGFRGTGRHKRVEQILKSPFYKGEFNWRGERYQGQHDPILSPTEWRRLQETFDGKYAPHRAEQKDAALAGFLRCGACGCRITYDPKTKKSGRTYHYYRCANGRREHERLKYVGEAVIFDGLEPALDAIAIGSDLADRIARELNKTHAAVKQQRRQEAARYSRALAALTEREDRLFDRYDTHEIDRETYDRQLERVRSERIEQTAKLEQANEELDDAYLFTAQRILELAQHAKSLWKTRSGREKRQLLEELVSNPTLTGATVGYDLKKPFAVLAEMRESKEWYARRDSNPRPSVPKCDERPESAANTAPGESPNDPLNITQPGYSAHCQDDNRAPYEAPALVTETLSRLTVETLYFAIGGEL